MSVVTLRNLCIGVLVKHGMSGIDGEIPLEITKDLKEANAKVCMSMNGTDYYQYYEQPSGSFDMAWNSGAWTLKMRDTGYSLSAEIRAEVPTFLQKPWNEVFGLGCSAAAPGFKIIDFNIDADKRKVTFHGEFRNIFLATKLFASEFWFSKTSFFLRIKCCVLDKPGRQYRVISERCLEQPDMEGWHFLRKDNEFHDPPFHYPLFQKYH